MSNIALIPQLPADILQIVKNGDFRDGWQFFADAEATPPVALDLTGIDFYAAVRPETGSHEPLFTASTRDGSIILDAINGVLCFALHQSRLKNLPTGKALGDILAQAGGVTINLCKDNGPLTFIVREGLT